MPDDFLADFRRMTGAPLLGLKRSLSATISEEGSPKSKVSVVKSEEEVELVEIEEGSSSDVIDSD